MPRTVCGPPFHMEVRERGDSSFFFRPSVQPSDALVTTLGVQSFFLVLSPAHGRHRRLRIGRKRLPSRSGERFWARVERVGSLQRVLADQLEAEQYSTKTRGELFERTPRTRATWTAEGSPSLLDEEGAEIVVVGHSENLGAAAVAQCVQPTGCSK